MNLNTSLFLNFLVVKLLQFKFQIILQVISLLLAFLKVKVTILSSVWLNLGFSHDIFCYQIPLSPPWGRCEGSEDTCQVHSTILPKTHWSFYSSIPELDQLIGNASYSAREKRKRFLRWKKFEEKNLITLDYVSTGVPVDPLK